MSLPNRLSGTFFYRIGIELETIERIRDPQNKRHVTVTAMA
jgi:hypothetical protein